MGLEIQADNLMDKLEKPLLHHLPDSLVSNMNGGITRKSRTFPQKWDLGIFTASIFVGTSCLPPGRTIVASLKNVLVTTPNLQSNQKCVSHDGDFLFTDQWRFDFLLHNRKYTQPGASPFVCFSCCAPGELSVEEAQDPFLVSIHIIADPGESQPLQEAIDKVLAWIHPDLQLFRVSERRASRRRRKPWKVAQPALAVVLFLQEEYGEEQILQLHRTLQRAPWRHHHTERVPGRFLPYLPCSQDFFTLAPGTPLWAIRPVHYGKEIVRFTIYCRHDNYADILKFYELILRRSPSQRKTDFCIFPIFSNLDVDIQFSLKRLPCDQTPVPTDSSVLEFRVKDIGELVPLLPNPCSPISEGRWQTEDLDGNKILLQVAKWENGDA
ncbi:protein FAM124A [Leptonychotes weddellii]|uniref:Protein FAM124A n=1 Tax=Leptonychotes weddellii TaxID=9713 RepID=A0A2U3YXK3_LEPWE|nr:protein FAM124A [Leptonychotes weddellii]